MHRVGSLPWRIREGSTIKDLSGTEPVTWASWLHWWVRDTPGISSWQWLGDRTSAEKEAGPVALQVRKAIQPQCICSLAQKCKLWIVFHCYLFVFSIFLHSYFYLIFLSPPILFQKERQTRFLSCIQDRQREQQWAREGSYQRGVPSA